jgi:RES domain-containing protein
VLVHLEQTAPLAAYTMIEASVPTSLVATVPPAALPADWATHPVPASTQIFGDRWTAALTSMALRVPSSIVPGAWNILLNPSHPRAGALRIEAVEPFRFDPRLLSRR